MNIIKITQADFQVQKWDGGKTEEIFIYPEEASYKDGLFNIRISTATVEKVNSTFTVLDGVYRYICPLDSEIQLFQDKTEITVLKPFDIFEFDGAIPFKSKGKCRDFNLMIKGDTADGTMKIWNTDKISQKKVQLPKHSMFWIFSYDSTGVLNINDGDVEIGKMEFLKIENVKKYVTLKTDIKTKLIYGIIELPKTE